MSAPVMVSQQDARRFLPLPEPFPMWNGGVLHGARIAYESWGTLDAARGNAILLFTGLSPSAHAAASPEDPADGWWEAIIGPGKAIDTRRWFVVCVNSLGSCYGSTGPASIDPATGEPYRLTFPRLAVEDIARAGLEVMRALGVERIDTVMGPSLGGMVSLAFAAQFHGAARRLVSISGSGAASPFAIALRSVQREAITRDPEWHGGHYAPERGPRNGMRIARKIGTITYRSAAEWDERFGRDRLLNPSARHTPFGPEFSVEGYLEAQAERWVRAFDPNCYLYLSRAMDHFDLAAHGGSAEAAFRGSKLEDALVIGVDTDLLFPVGEQKSAADALRAAGVPTRFAALPSLTGHDSFLIDIPRFDGAIRGFLAGLP